MRTHKNIIKDTEHLKIVTHAKLLTPAKQLLVVESHILVYLLKLNH